MEVNRFTLTVQILILTQELEFLLEKLKKLLLFLLILVIFTFLSFAGTSLREFEKSKLPLTGFSFSVELPHLQEPNFVFSFLLFDFTPPKIPSSRPTNGSRLNENEHVFDTV